MKASPLPPLMKPLAFSGVEKNIIVFVLAFLSHFNIDNAELFFEIRLSALQQMRESNSNTPTTLEIPLTPLRTFHENANWVSKSRLKKLFLCFLTPCWWIKFSKEQINNTLKGTFSFSLFLSLSQKRENKQSYISRFDLFMLNLRF